MPAVLLGVKQAQFGNKKKDQRFKMRLILSLGGKAPLEWYADKQERTMRIFKVGECLLAFSERSLLSYNNLPSFFHPHLHFVCQPKFVYLAF